MINSLSRVGRNSGICININSRTVSTSVRLYKQLLSYHKPTRTNRMTFFTTCAEAFFAMQHLLTLTISGTILLLLRKAMKLLKKTFWGNEC